MNPAYRAGRDARRKGHGKACCPHGMEAPKPDDTEARRQDSPAVRRAWWLAGFHDQDMEMQDDT